MPAYLPPTVAERFIVFFSRCTQFLTWPLLYLIFNGVFRVSVHGRGHFTSLKSPFIIISNHVAFYDPFFFRIALGLWTSHLPLRFMAVTKFNSILITRLRQWGIIDFIYGLFGVFTVVPGMGIEENLKKAFRIIETGGNVVIYPEGSIALHEGIAPFKNGAAMLAERSGAVVMPVSFRFISTLGSRRHIHIVIGESFSVTKGTPISEVTALFESTVKKLYESVEG